MYTGCGSGLDNGGLGSGVLLSSVCGVHSECVNDAKCQCEFLYFSPSGNHTDCQSTSGVQNVIAIFFYIFMILHFVCLLITNSYLDYTLV